MYSDLRISKVLQLEKNKIGYLLLTSGTKPADDVKLRQLRINITSVRTTLVCCSTWRRASSSPLAASEYYTRSVERIILHFPRDYSDLDSCPWKQSHVKTVFLYFNKNLSIHETNI
ncbi:hypothetical protein AVEN_235939-1 [Araneus ventricosus]|uniref:Uncharacterized protein n=1 Tax=Araneus ventricosus TaxID=182803 RepID=A0A4Y2MSA6_ARAVE|nr:hypothetical protein AVEN_235939-1 [Araneus ventricosus]